MNQRIVGVASGVVLAGAAAAAAPTMAQLHGGHRILLVSGAAGDPSVAAERKALAGWERQGAERDVAPVFLEGSKVEGASDGAADIRKRYALPAGSFALALIGKDGHVAVRATKPVEGAQLEQVIDAMPMRRAGQR